MGETTDITVQRAVLRRIVDLLNDADPGHPAITEARNLIAESGIRAGLHVGTDPASFDDRTTAEWLLGQIADVIDQGAWFAMNSAINIASAFLGKAPA